jgi:hypothetical protein
MDASSGNVDLQQVKFEACVVVVWHKDLGPGAVICRSAELAEKAVVKARKGKGVVAVTWMRMVGQPVPTDA